MQCHMSKISGKFSVYVILAQLRPSAMTSSFGSAHARRGDLLYPVPICS